MGKSYFCCDGAVLKGILILIPVLIVVSSCSGDSSSDSSSANRATLLIDDVGATLSLDDKFHLYVPEGAVGTPTIFALEEVVSPASPPEGFVQVGAAFEVSPGEIGSGFDVALGMEFDYPHDGELSGKRVQLSRLGAGGEWTAVSDCGTSFPLGLSATVSELGMFAAHIDTTLCNPADVLAMVTLRSGFGMFGGDSERSWRTHSTATFWNNDQSEILMDTGGPVRVGGFQLGAAPGFFYYSSYMHEVDPGTLFHVRFSGGEEVPALDDTLKYFDEELVLVNPSEPMQIVSRTEPFVIEWSGDGPQMVWLVVYGNGVDGEFVFNGGMVGNSGEFVFGVEEMAKFEEGTGVTVFLQRTLALPLVEDGFGGGSYWFLEGVSAMGVVAE